MGGSASGMQPQLITDPAGIGEIEDEWRSLAELRSNVFVTPEWLRAWWDHQGHVASSLLIVAVRREDGSLAGVMPLALDASSRPRAIRFAGATLGDRFHPVAEEAQEAGVAASALSLLQASGLSRHLLMVEHVEPERPWLHELRKTSSRRLAMIEQDRTELLYIALEGLDWDTYLSQRSKKFRSNLRRAERMLIRDHNLNFRISTKTNLQEDLDHLFRLHALRWRGRGGSSLESPGAQAMLRAFAVSAQQHGWLRLHILEADDTPVAALLGWRIGETYAFYNSGFDPAWSKQSVGTVMTSAAIRTAIEDGAREFDFLLGTEAYKSSFTTTARPGATIVLTRAMHPTRLLIAGETRARRAIAGRPALGRVVRSLARLVPRARRS